MSHYLRYSYTTYIALVTSMRVLGASLALLMCWSSLAVAESSPIKVGVLLCLTGECAEPGNNALKGVQLAVEELNAQKGILGSKLSLVVEDSHEFESASKAVAGYKKLRVDPLISVIIGPTWTVGGLPLIPIVSKEKNIIAISPSLGVADFNEAADHMFNLWPHDKVATEKLAQLAIARGWMRAGIFSNLSPWESAQAKVFSEEYRRLGGVVSSFEEPPAESRNLQAEALRIKSKAPDVVFMSNYTQMDVAARSLRNVGYKNALLAILMDETRIKNADGALEGAIFARYADPAQDFADRFFARFNEKPGIAADTGYDSIFAYEKAVALVNTLDTDAVARALNSLTFKGASGTISFDGKGGVNKEPQLWVVENGKQNLLSIRK